MTNRFAARERLALELVDGILTVTLAWPERHNALTQQMRVDLLDIVQQAEADPKVKALVIIGAGDKAFSAGTNIAELENRTLYTELARESDLRKNLPTLLERLEKPSVAAIHGYCFGGGFELALGCTFRIATDGAQFALPEITLGQIPGSGGTQRLSRFVGLGWAMHMVLTGQPISADRALHLGLITEIVSRSALHARARALALLAASRAPIAFRAGRDAVLRSTETDLLSGIDYEKKLYAICMATEDCRIAMEAYREKNQPTFRGR